MCQLNRRLFCCSLIVLLLTVALAACQDEGVPDDIVVSVEETATSTSSVQAVSTSAAQPTSTVTPTFTPSATLTQTKTAVPTSTPTPGPTLTPTPTTFPKLRLTPGISPSDTVTYRLTPWSADHAHNLAILMEGYHEAMGYHFDYPTTIETYNWSFLPAYYAYAEAQLLFPNDARYELWQWEEINNRAMIDSPQNEKLYRDIIVDALNSEKISFDGNEIKEWFYKFQFYFKFEIQIKPTSPPPGFISSHVITIASNSDGTTFWVLETDDGFFAYPLYDNLDQSHNYFSDPIIGDLTGDGIPELVHLIRWASGGLSGGTQIIFDLSEFPPKELYFAPENNYSRRYFKQLRIIDDGNKPIFRVDGRGVDCPGYFSTEFAWNGQWIEQINFEIEGQENSFDLCIFTLGWGLYDFSEAEKIKTLTRLEAELENTRPTGNDLHNGGEFPPDTQDEFRYLLAVNHAFLGHVSETQRLMQLIIHSPSIPESQWIEPAEIFLSHYESAEDVYRACAGVNVRFSLRLALEQVASTLALDEFDEAIEQLIVLGVPVVANGRFDFDNNRHPEHWFIVQHQPGSDYELWILAASDVRVKAMFVDTVDNLNPTLLLHTASYPPANDTFQFTIGNDSIYNFIRRLRDQEPYVSKLHAFAPYIDEQPPEEAALDQAIDDLLSGTDPQEIVTQLQTLADTPNFEPDNRYYYYLGLAYELLGDADNAVNAYLLAWQDCCDTWQLGEEIVTANPYAVMARAKLEPVQP